MFLFPGWECAEIPESVNLYVIFLNACICGCEGYRSENKVEDMHILMDHAE
jgi:hypothetical protein